MGVAIYGSFDWRVLMVHLTPFLLFDGNCAEAMEFYHSCLGGDLVLTRLGDTPMKDQMPAEKHQRIVYAQLKSGAIEFSATDWLHPIQKPKLGNMAGMYVSGDSFDDLKPIFDKLLDGADKEFLVELRDMPFGVYGHLTDRFGVGWFFRGEKQNG
jgi:PhnB protein